jgi:hypothetical protein
MRHRIATTGAAAGPGYRTYGAQMVAIGAALAALPVFGSPYICSRVDNTL